MDKYPSTSYLYLVQQSGLSMVSPHLILLVLVAGGNVFFIVNTLRNFAFSSTHSSSCASRTLLSEPFSLVYCIFTENMLLIHSYNSYSLSFALTTYLYFNFSAFTFCITIYPFPATGNHLLTPLS